MEVEAVDEGTLGKILVAEGAEEVPVNTPIAILLEDGEDASALDGFESDGGAPKAAAPAAETTAPAAVADAPAAPAPSAPAPAAPAASGDRVIASPLARRLASQQGIDLASVREPVPMAGS